LIKVAIGQDSHRFDFNNNQKKLILGGVVIDDSPPLLGNSDADVILHAITNAISGITCVNILGKISDDMCLKKGISDSKEYIFEALKHMKNRNINHLSISVECKTPKISPHISKIRESISKILNISQDSIGITATSGENLTQFGEGIGIQVFCVLTTSENLQ
jgi:2-C-methyl-D-erythritol 2,4-cyclodiphosphate synthase